MWRVIYSEHNSTVPDCMMQHSALLIFRGFENGNSRNWSDFGTGGWIGRDKSKYQMPKKQVTGKKTMHRFSKQR